MRSLQEELASALDSRGIQLDQELTSIVQLPPLTSPFDGPDSEFLISGRKWDYW